MARNRRSFPILTRVAAARVFDPASTTFKNFKTPESLARSYMVSVNKIIKSNTKSDFFLCNLLSAFETDTHEELVAALKAALENK
jgi:hypothetical protein